MVKTRNKNLANRKDLLKAYEIQALSLRKIYLETGRQLKRLKLEEEHLFRMLADTRAKLPADSDVLKNEPESIRTALKERFGEAGLQTADGGLTTDQAEEQPSSKDRKRSKLPAQSRQSSNLRKDDARLL